MARATKAGANASRRSTPQRSEELVATAAKIFRERGYDATSIQDIADEMGILKGSIYHYIKTKEDLLWMIMREPLRKLVEDAAALAANSEMSVAERLESMAAAHGEAFESQHPHMFVITQESGQSVSKKRRNELNDLRRQYTDLWTQVVADGVKTGELRRDIDQTITVFTLIGAINWMFRWFDPDGRLKGADAGRRIAREVLRGIQAG